MTTLKYTDMIGCQFKQERTISLDKCGKFLFFICILMEKNEFLARLDYLQWPVLFLLMTILFKQLWNKNKILNDSAFIWVIVFTFCVSCSMVWAINTNKTLVDIKYFLKIIVVTGYLIYIVKKDQNIDFLIWSMILTSLLSSMMIIPNIIVQNGSQIISRAQIKIYGIDINANQVCPNMAFSIIFLMYKIRICKKRLFRLIYLALMGVFLLSILFLGARASLLVVLGGLILNALTGSASDVLRKCVFALFILLILFMLVMNVPALYDAIGHRLEDTINLFLGNTYVSENQKSDNMRMQLIANGWDMFLQKPLFGYGSGNYADINLVYYGSKYYSHNNYIELLVGLGVTGTLAYYLFHFKLLLLIYKSKTSNINHYLNLAKQVILCMLLLDITYVTYNVLDMWLCLLIAYGSLYLGKRLNEEGVICENSVCA